ncbi:hypothetical protein P3X46_024478 [Hevea brasiliensis]|uniref:Magnesium transporter n=1 Tax=Hevea brasiliensis TaxID=3981 RepID=A0ABQ9L2L4_HEVBR|nr:hypothetical protein P3X46_024478 [Hevea brasiliensis]
MGRGSFIFSKSTRRRLKKKSGPPSPPVLAPPPPPLRATSLLQQLIDGSSNNNNTLVAGTVVKMKNKVGGARLWMRFDRSGNSELMECDKSAIIKRVPIPARDLRILGPVFSHSSKILATEKAMVVNLEFIRAIVRAEEFLILDPLHQEVLPFWVPVPKAVEGLQCELPFEFLVLEIALEVVCTYLDSNVADLERDAYPVLDELARNVSTKNLEHVQSLKSNLTRFLHVRDEIEHLLDDNEDMADLFLTRKWVQNQQAEALLGTAASNSIISFAPHLRRLNSSHSASLLTGSFLYENDVEKLERLLDAYFMQLDGTHNKILSVREYIDDTEDYVNIQLDQQQNELIQPQLTLTIASFAIAMDNLVASFFDMNIPCQLYEKNGTFEYFVGGTSAGYFLFFLLVLGHARWKKLLGS